MSEKKPKHPSEIYLRTYTKIIFFWPLLITSLVLWFIQAFINPNTWLGYIWFIVFFPLYHIICSTFTDGQTLGKILLGIRVVTDQNESTKRKFRLHFKRFFFLKAGTKVVKEIEYNFKKVNVTVEAGDPADEILMAAKKCESDIIVIGYKGYGKEGRFLLGSITDKVVRHAGVSVLVVR